MCFAESIDLTYASGQRMAQGLGPHCLENKEIVSSHLLPQATGDFTLHLEGRRSMKTPLNNDRLSHWLVGLLFSWGLTFLLLFLPIFHVWLQVPTRKVATLTGLFCAVQLAVTPWLFSARATRQNPSGRPAQRAAAVAVMASLMALLFFAYIGGLWPRDEGTREFAFIGLGLTALLVIVLVATRRRWSVWVASDSQKNSSPSHNPGTDGKRQ